MEYSVLLLVCGVIYLADITEEVSIENCRFGSPLDIRENAENNITCRDFEADASVTWWLKRPNISAHFVIATCTPVNCTVPQTGQFTVQRSPQESQLVYRQQNRTEDHMHSAQIVCESANPDLSGGRNLRTSCRLNVISPAILSGCVVEEDTEKRTVKGSCHFEHAYSADTGFTCIWYQTKSSDQSTLDYSGHLIKEVYFLNGQVYERGQCSVSISGQHWNAGDYSYTIDFYPGPGRQSVPIRGSDPPLTTTPTPGPPSTATSTGAAPPATRDDEKGEKHLGAGFVPAGVGVALAVVIVVVVVVVVRQRCQQWILPCAGNSRRTQIRDNSPTAVTPTGDNSPTTVTPTGDNSPTTERSPSPAGDNSPTTERSLSPAGDNSPTQERSLSPAGDNSPTTERSLSPAGDNSPTTERSLSPAGDNSPTAESSQSPTGENSSTTMNNPLKTGDNSPANNYESLRTSNMGLRSVYSALAGPDYYNTGFAAGGTGDSTGEATGPGGETSPIYQN